MILLDTSALYALTDTADESHAAARRGLAAAEQGGLPFVVHTYVLAETFALVHRRLSLRAAVRMSDELAGVDVVVVDRTLHDRGVSWLRASPRSRASLIDAVSFVIMAERGIEQAFAFDADFERAGFSLFPGT